MHLVMHLYCQKPLGLGSDLWVNLNFNDLFTIIYLHIQESAQYLGVWQQLCMYKHLILSQEIFEKKYKGNLEIQNHSVCSSGCI